MPVVPRVLNRFHDKIVQGVLAAGGLKAKLFIKACEAKVERARGGGQADLCVWVFVCLCIRCIICSFIHSIYPFFFNLFTRSFIRLFSHSPFSHSPFHPFPLVVLPSFTNSLSNVLFHDWLADYLIY